MKDTNEKEKNHEEKINFQSLGNVCLLIIAILIIGNAILIYYLANSKEYEENSNYQNTINDNTIEEEKDTVANILNTALTNNITSSTVDSTDVANRKVMNENLIVLYNGLILDTQEMKQVELKYIDNNNQDKDKYIITYYNYDKFAFRDSSLGVLSDPVYEGFVKVDNIGKIAISENYEAIPREIKVVNTLPTSVSEKNQKLLENDSIKTIIVDLDGNGTEESIIIVSNKTIGNSKIFLYDSFGSLIDELAHIEKSKWNLNVSGEYYLSLDNVNVLDVDNDGIMEILVEIPKYEGEPSISILKYANNKLEGKTNIECSLLP